MTAENILRSSANTSLVGYVGGIVRISIVSCVAVIMLALGLCAEPFRAQSTNATLGGQILDQSGRVVVGVAVVLTNLNTNLSYSTQTNGDGIYNLPALPPGIYRANITKDGFKSVVKGEIELHTQDNVSLNFAMQVGSVSETVTVSANTQHMASDDPAVGVLVNRDFVEHIPLNGRSFGDLISLAAGTVYSSDGLGLYSVNGQRDDANYYSVDGVASNTGINGQTILSALAGTAPSVTALGTTQSLVSVDALQEFKIQTSGYTAEYGRQPGGQVEFTTRSGTNQWHGRVFDYLRNTAFDANNWFANSLGIARAGDHQNDFGGTFGGPLTLPRLYNGKDRTFFFVSYEGLRLHLPQFASEYDPTTALRESATPGVLPYLNAFPVPPANAPAGDSCTVDGTPTGPVCDARFSAAYSNPDKLDSFSIRVDHSIGERFHLFGRYQNTPSSSNSRLTPLSDHSSIEASSEVVTLGSTMMLSKTLTDELRFNFTQASNQIKYYLDSLGGAEPLLTSLLIPSQYAQGTAQGNFVLCLPALCGGSITIGNLDKAEQKQFQLIDSIAWSRGRHALKFGGDYRRLYPTYNVAAYNSSVILVSAASVQQGTADGVVISAYLPAHPTFNALSLFLQDHWKIKSSLSLDYGLRWEFNPAPGASDGIYPITVNQTDNLATMQLAAAGTQQYHTRYTNFAPRFGLAFQVNHSPEHPLVLRLGGGVFYDIGQNLAASGYASPPYFNRLIYSNQSFPLQSAVLAPPSPTAPLVPPYTLNGLSDPNLRLPYTEQWNVSLDEGLSKSNTLTLSYVGNLGRRLLYQQFYPDLSTVNPNFSQVYITRNSAASQYNGLQVVDQGYIVPGLQGLISYTWAHARDSVSQDSNVFPPVWGNSDNDIRQTLNLALSYQVPESKSTSRFVHGLSHGWVLAERFIGHSGYPLDVIQGQYIDPSSGNLFNIRPNLASGEPIYLHGVPGAPGGWSLNPNAFSPVATDPTTGAPLAQGNLGRNFIHGPNFWALNSSVERAFPFRENFQLKFRVDAFNIFNHPNFTNIDTNLFDPSFGHALSLATTGNANALYATGSPRSLQLSLSLQF